MNSTVIVKGSNSDLSRTPSFLYLTWWLNHLIPATAIGNDFEHSPNPECNATIINRPPPHAAVIPAVCGLPENLFLANRSVNADGLMQRFNT